MRVNQAEQATNSGCAMVVAHGCSIASY